MPKRALGPFLGLLAVAACGGDDVRIVYREAPPSDASVRGPSTESDAGREIPAPFRIVAFTSSNAAVDFGEAVTLSWTIEGAPESVELDGVSVAGTTNTIVVPARRQTYELVARTGTMRDAKEVTVAARGIDVLSSPGSLDGTTVGASFKHPNNLAYDAAGNLYVTEWGDCLVRKVDVAGNVTTLAGSYRVCDAKDGKGTAAHFRSPLGIAAAGDGALYVADYLGGGVREIAPDGTVTTIATMARPDAVLLLPSGDLLVGDAYDGTIRRITPDHQVSLAYGIPNQRSQDDSPKTPTFISVQQMAYDAAGNVYAADACAVRKIDPAGNVSTYAGGPTCDAGTGFGYVPAYPVSRASATFGLLNGIASDPAGNVYVSDRDWQRIRRIDAGTGMVSNFVGGLPPAYGLEATDGYRAAAGFFSPAGLAMRPTGDLAVVDEGAELIRSVSSTGWVTTIAGQQSRRGRLDGPLGTNRIGAAGAFAEQPDGSIVFVDAQNQSIRRVGADGVVTTITGDKVGEVDGPRTEARFWYPMGLVTDAKGAAYVTELTGLVRKVDLATGAVSTFAGMLAYGPTTAVDGPPGVGCLVLPRGIVRDSKGDLFVADQTAGRIRVIKPDGTIGTLAGGSKNGLTFDGVGTDARMNDPSALAIDSDDTIYFDDLWGRTVRKAAPDGTVTTIAGNGAATGYKDGPAKDALFEKIGALAVDQAKNLYIADTGNDVIRMLSPDGIVSTVAGTSSAHGSRAGRLPGVLHEPLSLSVTKLGDLLVGAWGMIAQVTR